MEGARRAAEQAPRRPSLTNSHVPRDLETICFKGPRKNRRRVIPRPLRLAEDLERFCAGRNNPSPARWPNDPYVALDAAQSTIAGLAALWSRSLVRCRQSSGASIFPRCQTVLADAAV